MKPCLTCRSCWPTPVQNSPSWPVASQPGRCRRLPTAASAQGSPFPSTGFPRCRRKNTREKKISVHCHTSMHDGVCMYDDACRTHTCICAATVSQRVFGDGRPSWPSPPSLLCLPLHGTANGPPPELSQLLIASSTPPRPRSACQAKCPPWTCVPWTWALLQALGCALNFGHARGPRLTIKKSVEKSFAGLMGMTLHGFIGQFTSHRHEELCTHEQQTQSCATCHGHDSHVARRGRGAKPHVEKPITMPALTRLAMRRAMNERMFKRVSSDGTNLP